jgi:hypothetical protein
MSSHGAVFRARFAPLLPTSHLLQIVGLTWETVPPMRSHPWHNGSAIFCRARVADWVVIETTCLEAALFAATSLGGFPWEKRLPPTKGLGKNRKRSKVPQICRNRFAHACCIYRRSRPPQSTPRFLQTVRKMFGKCSELGVAPSPTPPRGGGSHENVRKVCRKCSELAGAPLPPLPRGGGSP